MKFTYETFTVEADARELRECQSLGANLLAMLNRCFQSKEQFDDDEETEEESE